MRHPPRRMRDAPTATRRSLFWNLLVLVLIAARVPAFAEPSGNDQSLYLYVGERLLDGGVPYVDAWDQKPPLIHFVYAALHTVWPWPSVAAFGDLLAAGATAWLLILLSRRWLSAPWGYVGACTYLLFSHPSLQRVSGVYVRGQCETFIALAVTAALVLATSPTRRRRTLFFTGIWLAAAFWLKYNALAYALPVAAALVLVRRERSPWVREAASMASGFALVSVAILAYFAAHGALEELRRATIDYNLAYSGETYPSGARSVARYLITMLIDRVRTEMIWFLGGLGAALTAVALVWRQKGAAGMPGTRAGLVATAWIIAAVVSILANGARELPQYFVQAAPALAFLFAVGLSSTWPRHVVWRAGIVLVALAGLWKVGVEAPALGGWRFGGLPQLVDNLRFDLSHLAGKTDRGPFLARFKGGSKYDAPAVEQLSAYAKLTTAPADRIFVFGFAPGVYVNSGRVSASRFFWSRPVIFGFASDRPDYGPRGLLHDLQASRPVLVALQKRDWEPDVANSRQFFMNDAALHSWLIDGYDFDHETPVFVIWRRRS